MAEPRPPASSAPISGTDPSLSSPGADNDAVVEWPALRPGTPVVIIKLAPTGNEVTRYPGEIIRHEAASGWVTARATWAHDEVDIDGVRFRPGDAIAEHFSPVAWFNAFEVYHDTAGSQGWYINVTYPTRLRRGVAGLELIWHDLYVDIVWRPDGATVVRDEDELAAAGLAASDPALHAAILRARDEILRHIAAAAAPFEQGRARPTAVEVGRPAPEASVKLSRKLSRLSRQFR